MDFPEKTQDYLKSIWDIVERTGSPAQLGVIAATVGQKTPTASEAIKRLAAKGLVEHEKYAGVVLTPEGNKVAVAMVRRHRLIEMFLVEIMGYGWDEVHDEADLLEHSVSDQFLHRVDQMLGFPTRDPHGDPIPNAQGVTEKLSTQELSEVALGERVVVEQIHDGDSDFLRYLADVGIVPGATIVVQNPPVAGMITVHVGEREVPLSIQSAADIRVVRR
ncbi:metal-dependent transcriptional regulator [Corynebacterium felinum]|uniref:Diphtheria toxin repressor n=1 Tax=Corynebacterium felinum TaxID=131318 RepID=A0ABU2B5V9_9CORY|nr:metal-dependent transcriptional regulator [Corynebacterium felinum]MDR7353994.1 DtxR family Mn-dependent transcriptional regulator [Corynebacterium felinum]